MIGNTGSVKYHKDLDALTITLRGEMSAEIFIGIYNETLEHVDFHPGISFIWDATRATIHHMPLSDFRVLSMHVGKSIGKRGRCYSAWLFRNIDDYRHACMVKALLGHMSAVNYEVFQSSVEAESWIRNGRKTLKNRVLV